MEFVTSDLVRLYIDGRDIRTDLGGTKTPSSSTTTTPKKYVDGGNKTENVIPTTDEELVVAITENTNESDVKHILSNIVSDATGETEVKEDVAAVLSEIVGEVVAEKQTQKNVDESGNAQEVLSDDATKTVAKTQVKDALEEIIDQTIKTAAVKEVLNEIVERGTSAAALDSTNETEKQQLPGDQEVFAGQNDSKESVQTISDKSEPITGKSPKDSLNESKESNVTADEVVEKVSDLSSNSDKSKSPRVVLNESIESVKTADESNETDISETHETLKAVVNTLNDIIENAAAAGTFLTLDYA